MLKTFPAQNQRQPRLQQRITMTKAWPKRMMILYGKIVLLIMGTRTWSIKPERKKNMLIWIRKICHDAFPIYSSQRNPKGIFFIGIKNITASARTKTQRYVRTWITQPSRGKIDCVNKKFVYVSRYIEKKPITADVVITGRAGRGVRA
jgi:hypothetical protein